VSAVSTDASSQELKTMKTMLKASVSEMGAADQPSYLKTIEERHSETAPKDKAEKTRNRTEEDKEWTEERLVGNTENSDVDAELVPLPQTVYDAVDDEISNDYGHKVSPSTFYPSQLGMCRRQLFLSKAGVSEPNRRLKGKFMTGSLVHESLEENIRDSLVFGDNKDIELEKSFSFEEDGLQFRGRVDMVNHETGRIIDFKTRATWYGFNPPFMKHVDQLMTYMRGLDKDKASLAYVNVKDFETRQWPNGFGAEQYIEFHEERWTHIKDKAKDVRDALNDRLDTRDDDDLVVSDFDDVPFPKCGGCDMCEEEGESKKQPSNKYSFDLTIGDIK
jgi:hypothetical protein